MNQPNEIAPAEAFEFLQKNSLPLIVSFSIEEERGHRITGKGLCYVEQIYGTSRVKLGRFSPHRALYAMKNAGSFYATFDIEGCTYGCIMENITADRLFLITDIPGIVSPFYRKFVRVEPSQKAPVHLYVSTEEQGTFSYPIRDISERGVGFVVDWLPVISSKLTCGIYLPVDGGIFLLLPAAVVYSRDVTGEAGGGNRKQTGPGVSFGLQLFPHQEDEKKIRLYVMQRELEIRKKIQEML
ncbi:MAG: PilZ domain-containing protein [Nitrospirae bacterium]|nr:PilZ domain-containing protein [Nitrospirota bacterium]